MRSCSCANAARRAPKMKTTRSALKKTNGRQGTTTSTFSVNLCGLRLNSHCSCYLNDSTNVCKFMKAWSRMGSPKFVRSSLLSLCRLLIHCSAMVYRQRKLGLTLLSTTTKTRCSQVIIKWKLKSSLTSRFVIGLYTFPTCQIMSLNTVSGRMRTLSSHCFSFASRSKTT